VTCTAAATGKLADDVDVAEVAGVPLGVAFLVEVLKQGMHALPWLVPPGGMAWALRANPGRSLPGVCDLGCKAVVKPPAI
jgi:hypothetical protein